MGDEEEIKEEPKQKQTECPPGAPMWMATFSDLVTLLLTFFVLLLSMANMDPVKFSAASASVKKAFGTSEESASISQSMPIIPSPPVTRFQPLEQKNTQKVYNRIKERLESLRLNKDVQLINREDNTIVLRINDNILFASGSPKLEPESFPLLRTIADIVRPLPMDMRIEGHTDNTPSGKSKFGNWDLSVERAVSVLRFYTQSQMFPLDRMSAVGYGKDRPIVPNQDEKARARNRRVDFLLTLQAGKKERASTTTGNSVPL
jgi:chemotaxis protein MotB